MGERQVHFYTHASDPSYISLRAVIYDVMRFYTDDKVLRVNSMYVCSRYVIVGTNEYINKRGKIKALHRIDNKNSTSVKKNRE